MLLGVWGSGVLDDEPEPETASKTDAPVEIVTPPVEAEPEAFASAESSGESGESGELEADAGEDESLGGPDPSKKKTSATKPRVHVEFVASQFYFVYVKVAGRVLTLEPKTSTRLPIGTHAVFLREKATGAWKRAGTITLRRGGSYRVEMKKPAGLELHKK